MVLNEGNAEWVQTLADGQTVHGNCISGYYGTISRKCIQSGSNADWDGITGSCDGILIFLSIFFFFFPTLI